MLDIILGLKTSSMIDVWTIEHLLTGVSIGHSVKKENKRHLKKHYPKYKFKNPTILRIDLILVLFLAYIWEAIEHYLETGLAGSKELSSGQID